MGAFDGQQAAAMGAQSAAAAGRPLSSDGAAAMLRACTLLAAAPGWASGRDVDTLVKKAARKAALRAPSGPMEAADVDDAAEEMLSQASRSGDATSSGAHRSSSPSSASSRRPDSGASSRPSGRPPVRPSGGGSGGPPREATATAEAAPAEKEELAECDAGGGPDLWACLERACVELGLGAADVLPDLQAARAPEAVVAHVAAQLGKPAADVRAMLAAQAPALARKLQEALAAGAELARLADEAEAEDSPNRQRQWICEYCHKCVPRVLRAHGLQLTAMMPPSQLKPRLPIPRQDGRRLLPGPLNHV